MKAKLILIIAALSAVACSENITPQTYAPDASVDYEVFYNQLTPYGTWMTYSTYGSVWIPNVPAGFSPYLTNGYWLYTNYGWTWYSYYSWGWAPFHYGRWHLDVVYGWMWIPDIVWGPAWVAWRRGGGYWGWAPLGPNISVNIVVHGEHQVHHDHWMFVRESDFTNHHVEHHRVDRSMNNSILERSELINTTRQERNVIYQPGPDRNDVQRFVDHPIDKVEIKRGKKPGSFEINNNRLELYSPDFKKDRSKTAPGRSGEIRKQPDQNIPRRQKSITPPRSLDKKSNPKLNNQPRQPKTIKPSPPAKPKKRGN